MKRIWVGLLVVLLTVALTAGIAIAEANDEMELVINDEELDLFSEPAYLDIPEEIELSFDESELPENEETGVILLDASLDGIEPTSVSASSVVANDGDFGDFEIINGILVKYNGPGGDVVIPEGVYLLQVIHL